MTKYKKNSNTGGNNRVESLLESMRATKTSTFGNNIELIDFYLYGELNSVAGQGLWLKFTDEANATRYYTLPLIKLDSTAEQIASQSASNYATALMSKGNDSFSIIYEYNDKLSDTKKAEIQKRQVEATDFLRDTLNRYVTTFNTSMNQAIKDYVEYGNCAIRMHIGEDNIFLEHIPFRNCFFHTKVEDPYQFIMYEELTNSWEIEENFKSEEEVVVEHIYIPEDYVNGVKKKKYVNKNDVKYLYIQKEKNKHNEIISRQTLTGENLNIFSARNDDRNNSKNQIYGKGCAIKSLSSIRNANIWLQLKLRSSLCTVYKASILPVGISLNTENTQGNDSVLHTYPSAVNILYNTDYNSNPMPGNVQFLEISSDQIRMFFDNYTHEIQQIESAFNSEIYTLITGVGNKTATEIDERKSLAIRQFNALSSSIKVQLLDPLIKSIFRASAIMADKPHLLEYNFTIKTYSFVDEQSYSINTNKIDKFIDTIGRLGQVEFPEDDDIKKEVYRKSKEQLLT